MFILLLCLLPLIFIILVTGLDSVGAPTYGAASKGDFKHWEEYNKNHKKYTELAESRSDEFFNESLKTINKRDAGTEAGKYRHAYRRAYALLGIYNKDGDMETVIVYYILSRMFYQLYETHAPTTLYGKQKLTTSPDMWLKYYEAEDPSRKLKKQTSSPKSLACIYSGLDKESESIYVGQTVNAPEKRWREHRKEDTGPYKAGCKYPQWDVIKGEVPVEDLDYWESFYIGYYNSYECGFNENRGNNWAAYNEGLAKRNSNS
ncbi:GIY-YIG nuclease family protein [Akkermansiaceae bacterium]|nr:GIY-YIG nuclease family protein [Akkermansiaceae bacterium]MDB4791572.1 GIY-YIG nuclease family protein [Akkermansiaceae bacterium]